MYRENIKALLASKQFVHVEKPWLKLDTRSLEENWKDQTETGFQRGLLGKSNGTTFWKASLFGWIVDYPRQSFRCGFR